MAVVVVAVEIVVEGSLSILSVRTRMVGGVVNRKWTFVSSNTEVQKTVLPNFVTKTIDPIELKIGLIRRLSLEA